MVAIAWISVRSISQRVEEVLEDAAGAVLQEAVERALRQIRSADQAAREAERAREAEQARQQAERAREEAEQARQQAERAREEAQQARQEARRAQESRASGTRSPADSRDSSRPPTLARPYATLLVKFTISMMTTRYSEDAIENTQTLQDLDIDTTEKIENLKVRLAASVRDDLEVSLDETTFHNSLRLSTRSTVRTVATNLQRAYRVSSR